MQIRGRTKAKKEVVRWSFQLKSITPRLKLGGLHALLLPGRADHVKDETPLLKEYPIPV
jgi:hypothetical protein